MKKVGDVFEMLKGKLQLMDTVEDRKDIRNTHDELKSYNYSPPFIVDIAEFTLLGKEEALKVLSKLESNNGPIIKKAAAALDLSVEEAIIKSMKIFVNEFELLQRLRRNEPKAWDHITELYEDD